jgi:hypothetical protein
MAQKSDMRKLSNIGMRRRQGGHFVVALMRSGIFIGSVLADTR